MNIDCMIELNDTQQLEKLLGEKKSFFIFKHSTRCPISAAALKAVDKTFSDKSNKLPELYYLDLLAYRSISNEIESKLDIKHQSPQLILVKDGKAVWSKTHWDIKQETILQAIQVSG